jgi:DNA-binding MarR family transcriptional regulator
MRSSRPGDRRVKLVTLTPAGVRLRQRLARDLYEPPDELLEMSTADLEALWAGATKLRRSRV